jgi:hypothetical protein
MNKRVTGNIVLLMFILLFALQEVAAQNLASRGIKGTTVHDKFVDSVSKLEYKYRFPILGEKLWKMGFDLPLPNGLMINYTYGVDDITISNLSVGTDPENLTDVSEIAYFSALNSTANVTTVRYDVWLLPFINISGIGGYVKSETKVNLALPFGATFNAQSNGPLAGWGLVAAGGVGPIFVTADYNMTWTFMPKLDKPSRATIFDLRVGHTFRFPNKNDMNISALIGAQYLKISSASAGFVNLGEALGIPPGEKEQASEQLDDWYNGLPPHEQELFGPIYDKIDGWLNNGKSGDLYYAFNKKLYYPWSMTVGANWQINKRWMGTALYTFLGSREQLTLGLNYRFGFKGKTLLSGTTF